MLIDLHKTKRFKVEYNGLRVYVEPLDKLEDDLLEQKYTEGKLEIHRAPQKKGFRKTGDDKLILPDVKRYELNLEKAQRTWVKWEGTSKDKKKQMVDKDNKPIPCTPENIELMFKNHYNSFIDPILDKIALMDADEEEDGSKN